MSSQTFLASVLLLGARILEEYGIKQETFARHAGFSPIATKAGTGQRLPNSILDKAIDVALYLSPDPHFGLRAGEFWHPGHLGTLGYAWLSSGTLRTSFHRLVRYTKLLGQRITNSTQNTPEGLLYIHDHGRGDTTTGWAMAEFGLSLVLAMSRGNFGPALNPLQVTFKRPAPADITPYSACFNAPILFNAPCNSILFSADDVDQPLPASCRELAATFDRILTAQLSEFQADDLQAQCRAYLAKGLTSGPPTEEDFARSILMGPRTLQRRLTDRGTSFRQILDDLRRELAMKYLLDRRKNVADISFMLGFSESSAFVRAFRRWTGKSPLEFRDHLAIHQKNT